MEAHKIKYPALFTSSDNYSIKAQDNFKNLNKWTLVALVVATVLTSLTQENWAIWTSTALILVSAILSTLMLVLKFEKGWYEGRAVAESIKTLCWKFMTGARPFSIDLNETKAQNLLIENFKKVIGHRKDFFTLIGSDFAENEQLPVELMNIRKLSKDERISIYKTERLEKQKKWYTDKTTENKKWTKISFAVIILAQVLAVISLILKIKFEFEFSIAPILVTISTAFIAWLQLRRYQELSQSYLITATELSLIKSKINQVDTESDFSEFVDDSETAISREHTLWLARRDNIELFK
ncbi:hypothetical protein Belba_2960 [Belliella baltica DSM 15883]|uniref:DUF4231 domain-containing protein n=1 Tax=Belliella baltica (strain DSM 15883 / CIP 108006 / LMG 21964 / BA134) TaxID=866536 RepID=I3Z8C0_BELBD|nr:DUF4231 domain-containing protein [Belliella baltica]AFL85488.1 hypothetical protein Belba_2960 [Belliella baltica DSM 15883]